MVTYDDFLQTCYDLANDNSSATLSFINRLGNVGYRRAMRLFGRQFEERTKTSVTVANQQYYQLPIDYSFMKSVKVLVGTYSYPLEEIKGQEEWDNLNRLPTITNTRPTKYFIRLNAGISGDEVGIWPTPSSAGNTITLVFEAIPKNIGTTAYTTGTVAITTNTTTLTGSLTAFTQNMVGKYLKVSDPQGDGQFYRVTNYLSSTSLTLQNYYEGGSVNNASYGIYDLFGLAEEAQMIPVYYTMWHYYMSRQNKDLTLVYKTLHDSDFKLAKENQSAKSRDGVVRRGGGSNLYVDYPPYFPVSISSAP